MSVCQNSPKNNIEKRQSLPHKKFFSPKPNSATSAKTGSSEKTCLSAAQRNQVDKIFAEDIKRGVEPRKKRMVAMVKSHLVLRGLVNSKPHAKRVIDRVRYLFDTRSIVDPYEVPEEPAEKWNAAFVANIPEKTPSIIASGRVEWTSQETEAIQEALTFWTKLPTKHEIQAKFQKS